MAASSTAAEPVTRITRLKIKNGKSEISRGATLIAQICVIVAVLAIWQLAHVTEWGRPILVQSPGAVWERLLELLIGDELWANLGSTLLATLVALALSAVVGIPIGLVLGVLPRTRRVMSPFLSALNAMPRVALAPVFIVLFGLQLEGKVALAFTIVVFIMILNAQAGAVSVDLELMRLMSTLGSSKFQTITKVVIPSAVPSILAGVRMGLIYSLLGVVTSELIAAERGIGQMIAIAAGVFDMATVYSIIFVLMIIAAGLNMITDSTERRLLRWQAPASR